MKYIVNIDREDSLTKILRILKYWQYCTIIFQEWTEKKFTRPVRISYFIFFQSYSHFCVSFDHLKRTVYTYYQYLKYTYVQHITVGFWKGLRRPQVCILTFWASLTRKSSLADYWKIKMATTSKQGQTERIFV